MDSISRPIVFWLLVSITALTHGEDTTVTFGGSSDYFPHHFLGDDSRPAGFDVDVFEKLADQHGWSARYEFGEWGTIQERLADGSIDVVPMFVSPERREQYLFSIPILSTNHRLYGLKAGQSHQNLYELEGQRVAAETNGYGWHELQRQTVNAVVIGTGSEAKAMQAVADGEADLALVSERIGNRTIEKRRLNEITPISPPLLSVDYTFAVTPERPELVGQIDSGLAEFLQSGQLLPLKRQWLEPDRDTTWHDNLVNALWILLPLLILLGVAIWQLWQHRFRLRRALHTVSTEMNQRERAERQAEHAMLYDSLTDLPKRTLFRQYISERVTGAGLVNIHLSLAIVELRDRAIIQQVMGYDVADELIKQVAHALKANHDGPVAHIEHGRFGLLFDKTADRTQALEQLKALLEIAERPYAIQETSLQSHAVAGLATYPEDADDSFDLYRSAELALLIALERHVSIQVYTPELEPDARNLTLMRDLKQAAENNTLSWVYQAKYSLAEERVIGAEMLVRWQHPEHGWLSPGHFIPLAEQTGIIQHVTRAAILQAIRVVRQWAAIGSDWTLSVNVSGNDLLDRPVIDEIIKRLAHKGRSHNYASQLCLEITETAIVRDFDQLRIHIGLLQAAGIRIALDDYGTGQSSLTYLKELNFDEIKIDMSFIKNMLHSARDPELVAATIQLGHTLGAKVTAEGVEDHATGVRLRAMGCDILQGFGLARPVSLKDYVRDSQTIRLAQTA